SPGYGLYVVGRLPRDLKTADSIQRDNELRSDLRFAQLTSDIFGALRQVHDLQRRHSLLLRFLSPRVARVLMTEPNKTVEELLEAKMTDATVLFCDLRGSCLMYWKEITVNWGESDPFGLVYYPRIVAWFN